MSAVLPIDGLPAGSGGGAAFARALRDPRVQRAARSLNVDLSDEATLQSLLLRTGEALEGDIPRDAAVGVDPEAIPDHYVRHAIRTYQDIDRMA